MRVLENQIISNIQASSSDTLPQYHAVNIAALNTLNQPIKELLSALENSPDVDFSMLKSKADQLVAAFGFEKYNYLECYNSHGDYQRYESHLQRWGHVIPYAGTKDAVHLKWTVTHRFLKSAPDLLKLIESKQVLKPYRKPHPGDGAIHSVEIHLSAEKEPIVKVIYTSAIVTTLPLPQLDKGDFVDPDYCNIFSTLEFPLAEYVKH